MKEKCENIIGKPKGYLTRYIGDDCAYVPCGNVAVNKTEGGTPMCKKCTADPHRSLC